jgi:hypothetical protein
MLVGEFPRTPGGSPKSKGFENPFQNNPTPCTNQHRTNHNNGAQSQTGFVPTIHKKNEEIEKKVISGRKMGKNDKPANGQPAVGGLVGEGPAKGREVVGR